MINIATDNRAKLFAELPPNSIAIIWGNELKYRSADVEYNFRQNSNFYYLTGFTEPGAVAIFISGDNNNPNQFILFIADKTKEQQIWTGPISTKKEIIEIFAADSVYFIKELDEVLPKLLANKDYVYQSDNKINNKIIPQKIKDLTVILNQLRLIKSDLELEKIRFVTQVSSRAHEHVTRYAKVNYNKNIQLTERHLQAEFYNYCLQHGCHDLAYNPIVATGANACVLHYTKNNALLNAKDLVLIDAGAEFDCYAADITRVFPVSGKFEGQQLDLYQLVLEIQTKIIKSLKPGLLWSELQERAVILITEGLVDLKLLSGNIEDLIVNQAYKKFYMHGIGHSLGLDVHDSLGLKLEKLLPGMVITIEPGIYVANTGIGVRIEDNILITSNSHEILTDAVKQVTDIEYLIKK